MAYISHKHKLLFVHIYKTAGMSVRELMKNLDESSINVLSGHSDILETLTFLQENALFNICLNYHRFSVVRNPYTWLYSIYKFAISIERHPFHQKCTSIEFDEFVNWYIDNEEFLNLKKDLNGKLQTQTDYIFINGVKYVDTILKHENLYSDMNTMLKYLHILNDEKLVMPKINQTIYDKELNCVNILNRKTLNKINEKYEQDFINFKYDKL